MKKGTRDRLWNLSDFIKASPHKLAFIRKGISYIFIEIDKKPFIFGFFRLFHEQSDQSDWKLKWVSAEILFSIEPLAEVIHSVIPAKAGIQKRLKILDSGSRFVCPE